MDAEDPSAEDPSIAGALGGRITVGAIGGHTGKGALAGGDGAVLSSKSIRCSGVLAFWRARSAVAAASAALRACVAAEAEAAAAALELTCEQRKRRRGGQLHARRGRIGAHRRRQRRVVVIDRSVPNRGGLPWADICEHP